jgi:hypothetical protein
MEEKVQSQAPKGRRFGAISATLTFLVGILLELYVLGLMKDFTTWMVLALSVVAVTASFVMLLRREC